MVILSHGSGQASKFICHQCGECCRQEGGIWLVGADITRLAAALEMGPWDFIKKYIRLSKNPQGLVVKSPCPWLDGDKCAVYEARPTQCREYPYSWKPKNALAMCRGLQEMEDAQHATSKEETRAPEGKQE